MQKVRTELGLGSKALLQECETHGGIVIRDMLMPDNTVQPKKMSELKTVCILFMVVLWHAF